MSGSPADDRESANKALWRRFETSVDRPPRSTCPDANRLAAYLDGRASDPEIEHVERHLTSCASCRAAVRDVLALRDEAPAPLTAREMDTARALVSADGDATPRAGRIVARIAGWAVAAAIVAAISVAGFQLGQSSWLFGPTDSAGSSTVLDPLGFPGPGL